MGTDAKTKSGRSLAPVALGDAYTDFILSRRAMNCTEATLSFYQFTAGNFVLWVASYGLIDPQEVTAWHVRRYLAELVASGKQDTTCHDHARAIEIINGFCTLQKQILELVKPVSIGAIGLRTSEIGRHIDQALLGVKSYNGKEKLQEAGIDIPDYYQEREKLWGGTN